MAIKKLSLKEFSPGSMSFISVNSALPIPGKIWKWARVLVVSDGVVRSAIYSDFYGFKGGYAGGAPYNVTAWCYLPKINKVSLVNIHSCGNDRELQNYAYYYCDRCATELNGGEVEELEYSETKANGDFYLCPDCGKGNAVVR